jgi:AcrR family transcriptional regulator
MLYAYLYKIQVCIILAMATRAGNRRRPKGNKRERTRAQLIDAAAAVIGERGWDRTSLDEVARRAGMSRGAIYGNFKDREELFLAVVQKRWQPVMPPYVPGTTFRQHMHVVGKAVAAAGPERRASVVGALSFMLYALTHEEMRVELERLNREIYAHMAAAVTKTFRRDELPMAPERLVPVLHGLADGLTFLRCLTPHLVTDEVIVSAFDAIARDMTAVGHARTRPVRGARPRRRSPGLAK